MFLAELPESNAPISREDFGTGFFEEVHWSWFLPTLKAFSEADQKLFLAAVPPQAAEQLSTSLSLKGPIEEITEIARSYLREQLFLSLQPDDRLLPPEYFPPSPLNRLASLSKKELTRLIDLLSLYDLAHEMRQIVETKILKKFYSFLSEEQKTILKQIGIHKDLHPLPKMGLDKWDGTEESLRVMLHRRGLMRFGIALAGQDPDLVWAVCHRLDIGRGGALYKLCGHEKPSPATETAQRQIEELLGLLQ